MNFNNTFPDNKCIHPLVYAISVDEDLYYVCWSKIFLFLETGFVSNLAKVFFLLYYPCSNGSLRFSLIVRLIGFIIERLCSLNSCRFSNSICLNEIFRRRLSAIMIQDTLYYPSTDLLQYANIICTVIRNLNKIW